jgi:hypothetical protein
MPSKVALYIAQLVFDTPLSSSQSLNYSRSLEKTAGQRLAEIAMPVIQSLTGS